MLVSCQSRSSLASVGQLRPIYCIVMSLLIIHPESYNSEMIFKVTQVTDLVTKLTEVTKVIEVT